MTSKKAAAPKKAKKSVVKVSAAPGPVVDSSVIERLWRDLPVALTDAEQLALAKTASACRRARIHTEQLLAKVVIDAKDALKAALIERDAEIARLDAAVADGQELRQVQCVRRHRAGIVEVVRLDTDEVVERRPALANELQTSIPMAVTGPLVTFDGLSDELELIEC